MIQVRGLFDANPNIISELVEIKQGNFLPVLYRSVLRVSMSVVRSSWSGMVRAVVPRRTGHRDGVLHSGGAVIYFTQEPIDKILKMVGGRYLLGRPTLI